MTGSRCRDPAGVPLDDLRREVCGVRLVWRVVGTELLPQVPISWSDSCAAGGGRWTPGKRLDLDEPG